MNAERLYSVASAILSEFSELNIAQHLSQTEAALANSLSQPNQPNADAFDQALEALQDVLQRCPSNLFVPTYRRILDGIEGTNKTGAGLLHKVKAILKEEQVTPASALSRFKQLRAEISEFHTSLTHTVTGLEKLGVKMDEPPQDTAEIGFLIPGELINNDFVRLNREMHRIYVCLRPLLELAGEGVAPPKIRSIGTGSFEVFLESPVTVAGIVIFLHARLPNCIKMFRGHEFYKSRLKVTFPLKS